MGGSSKQRQLREKRLTARSEETGRKKAQKAQKGRQKKNKAVFDSMKIIHRMHSISRRSC
jgi:hypothetical protein